MKKGIYDYWTGELITESHVDARGGRKLNESAGRRAVVILDKSGSMMCARPYEISNAIEKYLDEDVDAIEVISCSSYVTREIIDREDLDYAIADAYRKPEDGLDFYNVLAYLRRHVSSDVCSIILVTDCSGLKEDGGMDIVAEFARSGMMHVIVCGDCGADVDAALRTRATLDVVGNDEPEEIEESVSSRFAKYRKLYEDESVDECGGKKEDEVKECGDVTVAEASEPSESDASSEDDEKKDNEEEEKKDDEEKGDEDEKKDDDDEDIDIKTIVITVPNGKGEDCKKQMTGEMDVDGQNFSIPEDAVEVINGEDGEDDKVKVDAEYILDLKDYLSHKTMDGEPIDLEKILGIEIVDDEAESDSSEDDSESDSSAEDAQNDIDNFSFDDLGDQDWLGGDDNK